VRPIARDIGNPGMKMPRGRAGSPSASALRSGASPYNVFEARIWQSQEWRRYV